MNASISLTSYIAEWLTTFKETTVKQSTYDRLLTSVKALEGFMRHTSNLDNTNSIMFPC